MGGRLASFADTHGWLPFIHGTDGYTGRQRRAGARWYENGPANPRPLRSVPPDGDTVPALLSPGGRLTDDGWLTEAEDRVRTLGPFRFERSVFGYGWRLWISGRVRYNSPGATTCMWPRVIRNSADEFCNRVVVLHCWPLGHLDLWVGRTQRTASDGPCEACRSDEGGEWGFEG